MKEAQQPKLFSSSKPRPRGLCTVRPKNANTTQSSFKLKVESYSRLLGVFITTLCNTLENIGPLF